MSSHGRVTRLSLLVRGWAALLAILALFLAGIGLNGAPSPQVTADSPPAESTSGDNGGLSPDSDVVLAYDGAHAMPPSADVLLDEAPASSISDDACSSDQERESLLGPGSPGSQQFWDSFRAPLPPAPVWNPPGPKRVGLQVGHWRTEAPPPELSRLGAGGTSGGGRAEWEVNLDLARRTAAILEDNGVVVDILPETVPTRYRAHVFLAIHADGDLSGTMRGFKIARAGFSPIPEIDDLLVQSLYEWYGPATGLPRDDLHISRRMTYYYAFNSRRYCHAIGPGVPAAIIETGFLTSAVDRGLLLGRPDLAAEGIAKGILDFFNALEQPSTAP